MNFTNKPHVTYEILEALLSAPGQMAIHIHHLQGHYIPFVFFAAPGQEQTGYGPIIHADSLVAAEDAGELVEELRAKLGPRPRFVQSTPGAAPIPTPRQNLN